VKKITSAIVSAVPRENARVLLASKNFLAEGSNSNRTSIRRVLRNFPGAAKTIPRFSAVLLDSARFTAVRCPGVACSTDFSPDCTPRTRSRSPRGNNSTSSPGPTLPEIHVPVTTETEPFHRKRAIDRQPEISRRVFYNRACRRVAQRFFASH